MPNFIKIGDSEYVSLLMRGVRSLLVRGADEIFWFILVEEAGFEETSVYVLRISNWLICFWALAN